MTAKNGTLASSAHTAAASTPPGLSTRAISASARSMRAMNLQEGGWKGVGVWGGMAGW